MKKTRKAALTSSFVMLLIAALSLSSATFAWFTAGKTASVTDIEFTAEASSGIQISCDKTTWKSTISAADIQAAQSTAFKGVLVPVSTAGTIESGALKLYEAVINADGSLTTSEASEATSSTGGYYKFDLYFQNASASTQSIYLRLKSSDTDLASKVVSTGTNLNTQLASRVAMVASDQVSSTNNLGTRNGTTANIWEPNATTHTQAAKDQRHVLDSSTGTPTTTTFTDLKLDYVGINAATTFDTTKFTEGAVIVDGTNAELISTTVADETGGGTADLKIVDLSGSQFVAVTFYIWIEGQDADCMNDISGGSCAVSLNFYAK